MSTELLPCPYCGGVATAKKITTRFAIPAEMYYPRCCTNKCPGNNGWVHFDTKNDAVEAWNRRFVCLDKNGEKVFVGDKVTYKFPNWKNKFKQCYITELRPPFYGYGLTSGDDCDFTAEGFYPSEIELIKEDT